MYIGNTLTATLVFTAVACAQPGHDVSSEPGVPTAFVEFAAAAGQLPEGIAVKGDHAYVGFAPLGQISKIDLRSGKQESFATIPSPTPNAGFMTGLAFGSDGDLYAALVSFDPAVQPGIYRIGPSGGEGELFAKHEQLVFPNGLVFDDDGNLFVTESAGGILFKITPDGDVTPWAQSPLLAGDPNACGGSGNPFPIGANGLVRVGDQFFITNTDKGSITRIAQSGDGSAKNVELAVEPDCEGLAGADGLAVAGNGDLVVAVNRHNEVLRVGPDSDMDVLVSGAPAEFPTSLAWDDRRLIVTNFAFANASTGQPAHPGLLVIANAF